VGSRCRISLSASADGIEFHGGENRRFRRQAQFREVFSFEVQPNRLANICCDFVQCVTLGDDWKVQAFGNVFGFASKNTNLDRAPHALQRSTAPLKRILRVLANTILDSRGKPRE
jgi:hypothetical protein